MGVASGCWQLCRDRHFGIAWKQPGDSINCCGTQVRQVGEALMKHKDHVGKKECLVEVVQVREPADESTGRQGNRRIMRPPAEEVNRWQRTLLCGSLTCQYHGFRPSVVQPSTRRITRAWPMDGVQRRIRVTGLKMA
jgi:hypothetical protein